MRFFLPALALALTACPATSTPSTPVPGAYNGTGKVVLTVNGEPMYQEVLDLAEKRIPAEQLEQIKASGQYKTIVEQFAMGDVLYRKALEQGLQDRPDVQLRLALAQRDALAQALLEDVSAATVTDDKIKAAYDERKVRYARKGAKVDIGIFGSADDAKKAYDAVQAGQPLALAAASAGGGVQPLGWANQGDLAEPIDKLIFATDQVGLLDPADVGGRSILISVSERRDSTPLEDVREEIRSELEKTAVSEYTDKLHEDITIVWKDEAPAAEAAPATEAGTPAAPATEAAPAAE